MQQTERYYPQINSYNKPPSSTSISTDTAEAWLDRFPHKRAENKPNGGIIQSTADTREIFLRPMSKEARKAAIAIAQREHKQALKNLARQEAQDAKEIAKQLTKWRREENKKVKAVAGLSLVGQDVLKTLKDKGYYDMSDFPMSKKYVRKIVTQIRAMGYVVEPVRNGRFIVRYVLSK